MPGGDEVNSRADQPSGPGARPRAASVRSRARRLTSALVGAVLALTAGLGSGVATAYWTTTGTGVGAAATGTPQAVRLVPATGTVTSTLVPGGTADLMLALDNPNAFPVFITGIEKVGTVIDPAPGSGCNVTGVSVQTEVQSGLSILVASQSTAQVIVPGAAAMSMASDSACQGATFQIPVIVTVRS